MIARNRVIIASLIFTFGLALLGWGIQDWMNGYRATWLIPFPPQILWGIADMAGGYYVLKGGHWKDIFIRF